MIAARGRHDMVILGFDTAHPDARYGRLVMQGDRLARIVEYKDASEEERAIRFCNSGLLACDAKTLFSLIAEVGNDNAAGEYYLTEVAELANARGLSVTAVKCDEAETLGINSRADLAEADAVFQARARAELLDLGVTLMAPETVYLAFDTYIGRDSVIEPNVVFGPGVTVESEATIRAFSHLEGCHVSRGDFVEIKNAQIAEGAKVNHLSYIGDADVGAKTNIGAGTITCNYDGVMKHRTVIGERAFIGSNTMLVAPVTVGNDAMTATGSVITKDVPAEAMAVARARQENKPGLAVKLFEKLKAIKANKEKGQ